MNISNCNICFTGEFFVPGKSGERIESDHLERYSFACNYVKNKSVLDIACGFGYAAPLLMKAGATKYEGVDLNKELIDNAKTLYESDGVKYYQGDIHSYDSNKLFDVIICFETIEHVTNYHSALRNLFRLLKSNGTLIISSPNRVVTSPNAKSILDKPSNQYHVQEFTVEEFKSELICAGFSVNINNIFGQRGTFFNVRSKFLGGIVRYIYGDPSIKSSPKVSKVKNSSRYIIVVSNKLD